MNDVQQADQVLEQNIDNKILDIDQVTTQMKQNNLILNFLLDGLDQEQLQILCEKWKVEKLEMGTLLVQESKNQYSKEIFFVLKGQLIYQSIYQNVTSQIRFIESTEEIIKNKKRELEQQQNQENKKQKNQYNLKVQEGKGNHNTEDCSYNEIYLTSQKSLKNINKSLKPLNFKEQSSIQNMSKSNQPNKQFMSYSSLKPLKQFGKIIKYVRENEFINNIFQLQDQYKFNVVSISECQIIAIQKEEFLKNQKIKEKVNLVKNILQSQQQNQKIFSDYQNPQEYFFQNKFCQDENNTFSREIRIENVFKLNYLFNKNSIEKGKLILQKNNFPQSRSYSPVGNPLSVDSAKLNLFNPEFKSGLQNQKHDKIILDQFHKTNNGFVFTARNLSPRSVNNQFRNIKTANTPLRKQSPLKNQYNQKLNLDHILFDDNQIVKKVRFPFKK